MASCLHTSCTADSDASSFPQTLSEESNTRLMQLSTTGGLNIYTEGKYYKNND